MSKEFLRIGSVALNFATFGLIAIGVYSDHWHEVSSNSFDNIVQGESHFEGLWNSCKSGSTGHWECWEQPAAGMQQNNIFNGQQMASALPARFYFYRAFSFISIISSFIGLTFLLSGMDGIRMVKDSDAKNSKLKIGAGLNGLVFGLVLTVFIMFRIMEWNDGGSMQLRNGMESMGYGMYCFLGASLFGLGATVLAFMGVEEARSMDGSTYQPPSMGHGGNAYTAGNANSYI